ncbi:MAG: diaminopimelate decarboxylase family protein [Desulfomonilia bacterium]
MEQTHRVIDECLSSRGSHLYIEECDTVSLAEQFGTPVFVISEDQLRRNVRRYRKAFEERWREGEVNILPAIKANWLLALRRILTLEGAGCDVYSPGELYSVLQSGVDPKIVSVNGGGKSEEHIRNCLSAGVRITVDDIDELEHIEKVSRETGIRAHIRLRLRPDFPNLWQPTGFANELVPVDIGFQVYKNGIPTEHIIPIGRRALASDSIEMTGVHMHLGRHHYSISMWEEVIRRYVRLIAELRDAWGGWTPREIDVGGGIPSPRDPFGKIMVSTGESALFAFLWAGMLGLKMLGEKRRYEIISRLLDVFLGRRSHPKKVPAIEHYAEGITSTLRDELLRNGIHPQGITLQIEPGRSLYGNAGIHLSRVLKTKFQTRPIQWNWVLLDTTYFYMTGGVFENNLHPFIWANKTDAKPCKLADIVGRSCYADRIMPEVRIPDILKGDLIAILETGAYLEVSACNFNAMPRPATILVTGDNAEVIRRADTQEEVFARDIVPERLKG